MFTSWFKILLLFSRFVPLAIAEVPDSQDWNLLFSREQINHLENNTKKNIFKGTSRLFSSVLIIIMYDIFHEHIANSTTIIYSLRHAIQNTPQCIQQTVCALHKQQIMEILKNKT